MPTTEQHVACLREEWFNESVSGREDIKNYFIHPQDDDAKSRIFQSILLASVTSGDTNRPVWACFANTESELRAFCANVRMGRKLVDSNGKSAERMEFLKSEKFAFAWQHHRDVSSVVIYQPQLFILDPGMVDIQQGIHFICMPGFQWLHNQVLPDEASIVWHSRAAIQRVGMDAKRAAALVPLSHLVVAYLDRRTRVPILADARFYYQLLLRLCREDIARFPEIYNRNFNQQGVARLGYCPPLRVCCTHERFEALLAEETALFLDRDHVVALQGAD